MRKKAARESHFVAQLDPRISRIRDLVNKSRRRTLLASEPKRWHRLCSAMDAIGDAEWAVHAHLVSEPEDAGLLYLMHFGFLQALNLEQDAVASLCKSLGYQNLADQAREQLDPIRQVRNDVTHMTDRENGRRFVGIVRMTMTPQSFETYSFGDDYRGPTPVKCSELSALQHGVLVRILDEVIKLISEDETTHRRDHRAVKLVALFNGVSYLAGKVAAGATRDSSGIDEQFALTCLDSLEAVLAEFERQLEARGHGPCVDEFTHLQTSQARDAIRELRTTLASGTKGIISEALAALLCDTVRKLEDAAASYDKTYERDEGTS